MAGQAGWYRAPGEEGLLRYWNGSAWTEHRQPVPADAPSVVEQVAVPPASEVAPSVVEQVFAPPTPEVAPPPPLPDFSMLSVAPSVLPSVTPFVSSAPEPAVDSEPTVESNPPFVMPAPQRHLATDPIAPEPAPQPVAQATSAEPDWSMDQFEKQFEAQFATTAAAEPAVASAPDPTPSFELLTGSDALALDLPSSRFAPQAAAATATQVQSAPVPIALATTAASSAPASAEQKQSTTDKAFELATATAESTKVKRNRKRVLSAVRGMVIGGIFIVVGVVLIFFATMQNDPPAGQLKAAGIVTSLGHPTVGCAPVARFAAAGGSFSTAKSAAISPCPVQLGQSVNVFYSLQHPGTTGLISTPSSISTIDWAIVGIGALLLLISVIAFFVRAGSVKAGVAAVRAGDEAELAGRRDRT